MQKQQHTDNGTNPRVNVVIATLDSCRWDTFEAAFAPVLKHAGHFVPAVAQGTYTYPSHMSLYVGTLPDVRRDLPYYNRFIKSVFRINERKVEAESLFSFPAGTVDIIQGFKSLGYKTLGFGAVDWFKHPNLQTPFDQFIFSGHGVEQQINALVTDAEKLDCPFFSLLNVGETHDPYTTAPGMNKELVGRKLMREGRDRGIIEEFFMKQVAAIEFIDSKLSTLFDWLAGLMRPTLVIVFGDHGECFGEDGLYGHGFYHQKVLEVPLGMFTINTHIESLGVYEPN